MSDFEYQIHDTANGAHIFIFKFDGAAYVFERKIFVCISEYRRPV